MGINYHVGQAVDVTTLALDRSISEDDVLFSTGFASVEDYADLYDENELAVHRPPGKPGGLGQNPILRLDLETSLGGKTNVIT